MSAAQSAERRVAFVVGNSNYLRFPALSNPHNDAEDVDKALSHLGFEIFGGYNLTREQTRNSLRQFARAAQGADIAIAYYAGHGLQYKGRNYIVPIDAKLQDEFDLDYETVRVDDVVDELNRSNGPHILILDACRNLPLPQKRARDQFSDLGLAKISGRGLIVAYATQANAVAYDGEGRNSVFTREFLKYVEEPGIDLTELFHRVSVAVDKQTGGRQTPEISLSYPDTYYLNPVETDRDVWRRIRDTGDPEKFRDFMSKYPTSDFADAAAAALERIATSKRLAEEKAAAAMRQAEERVATAKRLAEQERLAAEARRVAEERAAAETRRVAEEKAAEAKRLADEKAAAAKRLAEQERVAAEARRVAEERAAAEARKLAEEKAIEAKRLADEKAAKRLAEQERLAAEARRVAEEKAAAEAKRVAEEKAAAAKRLAEQERLKAEAKRVAEEKAADEARRKQLAEERAAAEAKRVAEDRAAAEAKRLADERAATAKRLAEQERLAAEARRLAEDKAAAKARPDTGRLAALEHGSGPLDARTPPQGTGEARGSTPIPDGPASSTRNLILSAQTELTRIACYAGPIDGILNAKTIDAIQSYARQNELQWSGDVGQNVVDWLRSSKTGSCAGKIVSTRNGNRPELLGSSENCSALTERARIGDLRNDEYALLREACR